MKILVLGATGPLGQQIVTQALAEGHEVTAFARTTQKLILKNDKLRVVVGDVLEGAKAIEGALRGQDAVISALGVGQSFRSNGLITKSMPGIVEAMEHQHVRRLIVTSAVILKLDRVPPIPRLLMRLFMRDLMTDKKGGEDVLRASGLDWTLIYPVQLTNGPETGRYRFGEHVELHGFPRVARADVADLILKQLSDAQSIRKDILVSN